MLVCPFPTSALRGAEVGQWKLGMFGKRIFLFFFVGTSVEECNMDKKLRQCNSSHNSAMSFNL